MATFRHGVAWGLVVAVCCLLGAPLAEATGPARVNPTARVRGIDDDSSRLLAEGCARSLIVSSLVETLEASDVVVILSAVNATRTVTGDLTWIGLGDRTRYLRLRVSTTHPSRDEVIEWLAHELQHAVEVAAAPGVRDLESFASLFGDIGRKRGTGRFETLAAIRVQRSVRQELQALRARARADAKPASSPDGFTLARLP